MISLATLIGVMKLVKIVETKLIGFVLNILTGFTWVHQYKWFKCCKARQSFDESEELNRCCACRID